MPNKFLGKGNLADAPTLKTVRINGEDRKVAEMRVFFDEYSRNADGDFEQDGSMSRIESINFTPKRQTDEVTA